MIHAMKRQEKPYRRKGYPGWWITVYNENGKRRRIMAGDTYEDAVVRKSEYDRHVDAIASGHLTRRQIDVAKAARQDVGEAIAAYLDELQAKATSPHCREAERYIRRFIADARISSLADITTPIVRRWLARQQSHDHALARIRAFCRWCVDDHRLQDDPTLGLNKKHAAPKKPARPLSMDQARALLDTCVCPRRRTRYLLGMQQGLRVEESGRLQWKHIDFDGGWIRLTADITKMKRNDDLPMSPDVRAALLAIRPDIAHAEAKIFSSTIQRYTWLRDLNRAGIISITGRMSAKKSGKTVLPANAVIEGYEDDRGRVLSLQALRKTYGTHLARSEPNVSTVAKLMRHTDPKLTLKLYEDARLMDLEGAQSRFADLWCQSSASKQATIGNSDPHKAHG